MATSGVSFNPNRDSLITALKNARGRISHACVALKCCIRTLRIYIQKDTELTELLADLREGRDHTLLDAAEDALERALKHEDPQAYLKSAFFVLNNKGRSRGYNSLSEQSGNMENFSQIVADAIAGKIKQQDVVSDGTAI